MKKLLILTLSLLVINSWASEIQTCKQLGDISGSYTTVENGDDILSKTDTVDTIYTVQKKKMKYIQEDIVDGETEKFDIKLKDTKYGCEIVGENCIITRSSKKTLGFACPSMIYFLLQH